MNKLLTLACALTMAFAASANAQEKHGMPLPPEGAARHFRMSEKLADDLNLTAEQRAQAQEIRKEGREKIKPYMDEMRKIREKMDVEREKNMQNFEKILTPEQKAKFTAIKAEMKPHRGGKKHDKMMKHEGKENKQDIKKL